MDAVLIQGFLFLYLPCLGIFIYNDLKSHDRDYRWLFVTAPLIMAYSLIKTYGLSDLAVPLWLWRTLRIPVWSLIPRSHYLAVGRKLRPAYITVLLILTALDMVTLIFEPLLFLRDKVMTPLFCIMLAASAIAPLVHANEIRARYARMVASGYFLLLLFGLFYALPVSLSSLILGKSLPPEKISGYINAALVLHGVLTILLTARLCTRDENEIRPFQVGKAFVDHYGISRKERDILLLLLEGYTAKTIAEKVYLSPQTVKNYTQSIYRKTNVNNKMELARKILSEQR